MLHELVDGNLERRAHAPDAERHRRAAGTQARDGLLQRLRATDGLDRPIHTPGYLTEDGLREVIAAGEDDRGGAEDACALELCGVDVGDDDRLGAREPGAHHRRQADAAGADDQQRAAGAFADDVEHGADPGDHRAARDRGDRRGDRVGHLDDGLLGDHRPLGEARHAHQMVDLAAVQAQPGCPVVGQAARRRLHAPEHTHHGLPGQAVAAAPAARTPQQRHAVARADALDARAHLLDDAAPS